GLTTCARGLAAARRARAAARGAGDRREQQSGEKQATRRDLVLHRATSGPGCTMRSAPDSIAAHARAAIISLLTPRVDPTSRVSPWSANRRPLVHTPCAAPPTGSSVT